MQLIYCQAFFGVNKNSGLSEKTFCIRPFTKEKRRGGWAATLCMTLLNKHLSVISPAQ